MSSQGLLTSGARRHDFRAHQWFVEASFSNDHSERVDASSLIAHCHISSYTMFLKMYRRWKDCTRHATVRCREGTWTKIDITVQFELAGLVPMMNNSRDMIQQQVPSALRIQEF